MVEQIVRHIASGHRLGRFELPERQANVWCWFLEDFTALTQDRSLRVAPRGSIAEDESGQSSVLYFLERGYGMSTVRAELEAAAAGERPKPDLIIIDYLGLLVGPQPSGISIVDWEATNLRRLRDMGQEFDCQFLVLTHTNKTGSVAGTQQLMNVPDTVFLIEPNPEDRGYAVMKCLKMRISPPADYALCKRANGTWGFDDQLFVSEAAAQGAARDILAVLRAEGPRTLSELATHHAIAAARKTIQGALTRLRKKEAVRLYRGHWEILPGDGDMNLRPDGPPEDDAPAACRVCGLQLGHDDGTGCHPTCDPRRIPQPRPAPAAPVAEDDQDADAGAEFEDDPHWPAYAKLKESVAASRFHPRPRVKKDRREGLPWSLVTEDMDGEPSARLWSRPAPDGRLVAVLDRNGSFPSAMSSVPLAPNSLSRTGPLGTDISARGRAAAQAGIYLIEPPEWTDDRVPHPLGRLIRRDGPVWITSPHLEMLDRLAEQAVIRPVDVLDSWTGKRSTSLFERFSRWTREVRAETAGTEQAGPAKIAIVRAIRSLHCETRSPFWRPDWHKSVKAEASVRHWMMAYRAVQSGAELVGLANVDEASFLVPELGVDHPEQWVPAGYKLGPAFGEIKHKDDVFIRRGEDKAPSPLTAELWNAKIGGGR